jgi:hypothetical protein
MTPDAARAPGADSLLKPFRLFEDAEDVQLATLGDLVQVGSLGHGRGADGTELVVQVETSGNRPE